MSLHGKGLYELTVKEIDQMIAVNKAILITKQEEINILEDRRDHLVKHASRTYDYPWGDKEGGMSFSEALIALKNGYRVLRAGWNGKGMWLRLVFPYIDPRFKVTETPQAIGTLAPYIGMKTADNMFVPWLTSQTDIFATDWCLNGRDHMEIIYP